MSKDRDTDIERLSQRLTSYIKSDTKPVVDVDGYYQKHRKPRAGDVDTQELRDIFDRANEKGKRLGITSEQQVYDILDGRIRKPRPLEEHND